MDAMQSTHEHRAAPAPPAGPAGREHPGAATDLAAALRARGLRVTPQREKVLDAVRALGHATPEQLCDAVAGVDMATVYRTLDLLEELGLVKHTHLGHGAPSYRPAEDEHIHLACHACGAVIDAPPRLVDELDRELRVDHGFVLDRGHFTVFGRCARCAAADEDEDDDTDTDTDTADTGASR